MADEPHADKFVDTDWRFLQFFQPAPVEPDDSHDHDDEAETLVQSMLDVADQAGSDEEAQAAIREIATEE